MNKQQLIMVMNNAVHTNGFGYSRVTGRRINRVYHWLLNKVKTG